MLRQNDLFNESSNLLDPCRSAIAQSQLTLAFPVLAIFGPTLACRVFCQVSVRTCNCQDSCASPLRKGHLSATYFFDDKPTLPQIINAIHGPIRVGFVTQHFMNQAMLMKGSHAKSIQQEDRRGIRLVVRLGLLLRMGRFIGNGMAAKFPRAGLDGIRSRYGNLRGEPSEARHTSQEVHHSAESLVCWIRSMVVR